jgi:hypothetical protein
MSLYVGQPIKIELSCIIDGVPLEDTVTAAIAYRKPSRSLGEWPATVSGAIVEYDATAEEIDEAGIWALQPLVTFIDGSTLPGTTVNMRIERRFS